MDIETYLSGFQKFTKKPSLNGMKWLMEQFENPQNKVKIIHVAGTNGKGSVCEILNSILQQAGYRVGKFISPHLITFQETICINNQPIPESELQEILEPLSEKIEQYNQEYEIKVTWFEVITSIAFIYFAKQNCDIAVIETGMGGTYDCTNIANSMISIITTIGYDHMDVLGNTIREIARNKAGIIKPNSDTVFVQQESEVTQIIQEQANKQKAKLHLLQREEIQNYYITNQYQVFDMGEDKKIEINLKGKRQIQNAMTCIEVIHILQQKGYKITQQQWRKALKTVVHPARFETLQNHPTIIFDGGHNETAIANLKESIQQYHKNDLKVYIISILETKDYKTILKQLVDDAEAVYFFTDGNPEKQYVPKEVLLKEAQKYVAKKTLAMDLVKAIQQAKKQYQDSTIFIVGSFYIYKTVKEELKNKEKS